MILFNIQSAAAPRSPNCACRKVTFTWQMTALRLEVVWPVVLGPNERLLPSVQVQHAGPPREASHWRVAAAGISAQRPRQPRYTMEALRVEYRDRDEPGRGWMLAGAGLRMSRCRLPTATSQGRRSDSSAGRTGGGSSAHPDGSARDGLRLRPTTLDASTRLAGTVPLHANVQLLAQRCRRLLCKAYSTAAEARRLPLARRTASRHQSFRHRA